MTNRRGRVLALIMLATAPACGDRSARPAPTPAEPPPAAQVPAVEVPTPAPKPAAQIPAPPPPAPPSVYFGPVTDPLPRQKPFA